MIHTIEVSFPTQPAPRKQESSEQKNSQQLFNRGVEQFRKARIGLRSEMNAGSKIAPLIEGTIRLLATSLDGLHDVPNLPESLTLFNTTLLTMITDHRSNPNKWLHPIEIDAVEAARLIVSGYKDGIALAPMGSFTKPIDEPRPQLHDPFENGSKPVQRPGSAPEQPRVVRNRKGDEFENLGNGRQRRSQQGVSVEGPDLVNRWNSPLPEGTVVDFSALMKQFKDSGSLHSFTNDRRERVPFAAKLPGSRG